MSLIPLRLLMARKTNGNEIAVIHVEWVAVSMVHNGHWCCAAVLTNGLHSPLHVTPFAICCRVAPAGNCGVPVVFVVCLPCLPLVLGAPPAGCQFPAAEVRATLKGLLGVIVLTIC